MDDDTRPDDDAALDPARMLALLEDQRRSVEGQMGAFVPAIILTWGIAWLFGFGALWLIDGMKPAFSLPLPLAVVIFAVLIGGSIVISTVLGVRSGRGLRGNTADAFTGTVYGLTWTIGSVGIMVFGQGLAVNGMSRDLANIFYPVAFVLFAGIMYVIAGAIWRAVPMLILGVWTVIVAVVAPFFGYPTHYLVLAIAGGSGYLLLSVLTFANLARLRRRVTARTAAVRRG